MAAPSSAPSIATQIRELSELRDTGIITEAEFETKKKDLLDRM
jgi:Short C-terminal domain